MGHIAPPPSRDTAIEGNFTLSNVPRIRLNIPNNHKNIGGRGQQISPFDSWRYALNIRCRNHDGRLFAGIIVINSMDPKLNKRSTLSRDVFQTLCSGGLKAKAKDVNASPFDLRVVLSSFKKNLAPANENINDLYKFSPDRIENEQLARP